MTRIKIEVTKIEDDKYYVIIESTNGVFAQHVCNKEEAIDFIEGMI